MDITNDPKDVAVELPQEERPQQEHPFKEACFQKRAFIEDLKKEVLELKKLDMPLPETLSNELMGEMKANIQIAYRHLEDARMRLGKAIQAFDGGVSCLPR